jgi:hypothetical protein
VPALATPQKARDERGELAAGLRKVREREKEEVVGEESQGKRRGRRRKAEKESEDYG